ncbi:MAG: choice-of-anchor D domain-containing protein [Candidatus Eisenbacteria bacterium]|uniref:Choice-of-anchor D domain-containing protein n=1 Tax=Eiseniibacteriota bacterium TaxID=2212470 RepID=A0A538TS77_UNCEI|nr:MAG: choice-of-anchor D domain-containing protein [Candidatus Eisenbacteria bacterium]
MSPRPPCRRTCVSPAFPTSRSRTTHSLAIAVPPRGDGAFELDADGDYGFPPETATLTAEGYTLGQVGNTGTDCTTAHGEFAVDAGTLAALTADGIVHAEVQNTSDVNDFCSLNRHIVKLRYLLPAGAVDFGSLFVGSCVVDSVRVSNLGTDSLRVTSVQVSHPAFTVTPSSFVLAVGESRTLRVTYCPATAGLDQAVLSVQSNDPDTPTASLDVRGTRLAAPGIVVSPTQVVANLPIPASETRTLTIRNTGGCDLQFTVESPVASAHTVYEVVGPLAKGHADPRSGILGSGGPDQFGYRWTDSDEPGGPSFAWVDISDVGQPVPISGDDAISGPIDMGMSFPFYGNTFSTVYVCTNGFLTFSPGTGAPFGNQPLPTPGAPPNLIAPFWDDLIFSSPRVSTYFDGARFIVSWVDVVHYGAGGPYTFQAILYPNGRIVYQYLSMAVPTVEATVGIQNAAQDDGLTVVFNTNYIHNSLAVQLQPFVPFLGIQPTSGVVPPGGSLPVQLSLSTVGVPPGVYRETVSIRSNDPDEALVTVPVALNAGVLPDIAVSATELDFGLVYVGQATHGTIEVSNTGSGVLELAAANVADSGFSLASGAPPQLIDPGRRDTLTLRFAPSGACAPCTGTLTLQSDDPDENPLTVSLSGTCAPPPDIDVSPASLRAAGATTLGPLALRRTKTLLVQNTGGSDLEFSVARTTSDSTVTAHQALPLAKGQQDPRAGILGRGGPDRFGYRWRDSEDSGGPPFGWVDITGIGQQVPLSGDDALSAPIAMGMTFPFYGASFNAVRVCTNGFLTFTGFFSPHANQPLPSGATPPNLVAPFWDDLAFTSRTMYTHFDGLRFVVAWTEAAHVGGGGPYTFEAILYPSGEIIYQYLSMASPTNSATVGIQNGARDDGLTAAFNASYIHDSLAIRFLPSPRWLTVNPSSGIVPAGSSQALEVLFDASDLADGDYAGELAISSNDPDEPFLPVSSQFHVGVTNATFDLDPNTLNRSSHGLWAQGTLELLAGQDPHQAVTSTVRLQRAVAVAPNSPLSFSDDDHDGLVGIGYKFDRSELAGFLPAGDDVPVELIGELADLTWFRGTDHLRVLPPQVDLASGDGEPTRYIPNSQVELLWNDPPGASAASFDLWYSATGGETWSLVSGGMTSRSYVWTVPTAPTDAGRLELVARDDHGVMGSWLSTLFIIPSGITGVKDERPASFGLRLVSANPSPGAARLELAVPERAEVEVRVHDVHGRLVRRLASGPYEPGRHMLVWDGRGERGDPVGAGIYFARLVARGRSYTVRLALIP